MEKEIDARGMNCPFPVIHTKKALESMDRGRLTTIVDNETAKENVLKLAKSMDLKAHVKQSEGNYYVYILKGDKEAKGEQAEAVDAGNKKNLAILITKDVLGSGSDELGALLMKSYFYSLTEASQLPTDIMFLNSGVKLATEGSEVLEYIRVLESKGVEIVSCAVCLDYFELKDKLAIGAVGNMYTIVEKSNAAGNTITI